jgi:hypothetical protein
LGECYSHTPAAEDEAGCEDLGILMLFKISVVLVGLFAIVVLLAAMYAHISYALIKMDEERDIS